MAFKYFVVLLVLALGTQFISAQDDLVRQNWRAQYYDNSILDGDPVADRFDGGIGYDWGRNAPDDDLPADNFSVRWGKAGFLPAGTYRFIVTADEGFRLYVNDEIILDHWDGSARGETVGRDIFLEAGEHKLQLDYYELTGDALVFLDWGPAPAGVNVAPPAATASATSDTATINAARLNVRSAPQFGDNIIGRVTAGEQYTILERSADNAWVRLNLGDNTGWVSAAFVSSTTPDAPAPASALQGLTLQANARVNLRSEPSTDGDILGVLLPGQIVPIIARDANVAWWQVSQNGIIGWVSAGAISLSPDVVPASVVLGS